MRSAGLEPLPDGFCVFQRQTAQIAFWGQTIIPEEDTPKGAIEKLNLTRHRRRRGEATVRHLPAPGSQSSPMSKKQDLHLATLEVLKRTGVRVFSEEALDLMRKAGCAVSDGTLVKIPTHLNDGWRGPYRDQPPLITAASLSCPPAVWTSKEPPMLMENMNWMQLEEYLK